MKAFIEQQVGKIRVFVDNVAHKRTEFGPDDLSISTERSSCTPVQMVLARLDPFSYRFQSFFF